MDNIRIIGPGRPSGNQDVPIHGDYSRSHLLEPPTKRTRSLPSLSKATDHILAELLADRAPKIATLVKPDTRGRYRYRDTLRLVLCNLLAAWTDYDHGNQAIPALLRPYIAYPRDANQYTKPKYKGLHLTYKNVVSVVDGLYTQEYIEHKNGFYNRSKGEGKISRMRATPRLILVLAGYGVTKNDMEFEIELVQLRRKITKRNKRGDKIKVSESISLENVRTESYKSRVAVINEMLSCANAELRLTHKQIDEILLGKYHDISTYGYNEFHDDVSIDYNTQRNFLYRVFNDKKSLNLGGRFYGHWAQVIPKRLRRNNIFIGGNRTVEIDYDAIHPSILYKKYSGIALPAGDLYTLDGYDMSRSGYINGERTTLRTVVKIALLTLINADKETGAIQSLCGSKHVGKKWVRGRAKQFCKVPSFRAS